MSWRWRVFAYRCVRVRRLSLRWSGTSRRDSLRRRLRMALDHVRRTTGFSHPRVDPVTDVPLGGRWNTRMARDPTRHVTWRSSFHLRWPGNATLRGKAMERGRRSPTARRRPRFWHSVPMPAPIDDPLRPPPAADRCRVWSAVRDRPRARRGRRPPTGAPHHAAWSGTPTRR